MTPSGALCAETTSRGYRCINKAKDGPLCPAHNPRNQCHAPTRIHGAICKRMKSFGTDRCSKHQS